MTAILVSGTMRLVANFDMRSLEGRIISDTRKAG